MALALRTQGDDVAPLDRRREGVAVDRAGQGCAAVDGIVDDAVARQGAGLRNWRDDSILTERA